MNVPEGFNVVCFTADTIVKTGEGNMRGFACAAATGATLTLYDNTAASGTKLLDAWPLVAGQMVTWPVRFTTGLYADITGTCNISLLLI